MKQSKLLFVALFLCYPLFIYAEESIQVPSNEIWYTSADESVVRPIASAFKTEIISNTYENGKGIIRMNKKIMSIGHYAFKECKNLKTIQLPEGVVTLGGCAFYKCESLETVSLPQSLFSMEIGVFYGCSSLKRITIPKEIKTIKRGMFSFCESLEEVALGNVKQIEEKAFSSCSNLKRICLPQVILINNDYLLDCLSKEGINCARNAFEADDGINRIAGDGLKNEEKDVKSNGSFLSDVKQCLEVRPQFGHDPIRGDVSDDGKFAVTVSRSSVVLWDLIQGNVIKEQPFWCMGASFIKGYPFYCVALDMFEGGGRSLNSLRHIRTVVNMLTGEVLCEIEDSKIDEKKNQSPFQITFPYDPNGRFVVTDNRGQLTFKGGGKLSGGIANAEISSDGKYLLLAGKHPTVWNLDNMTVYREIPSYEYYMNQYDLVDAGLDIIPLPHKNFNRYFKRKGEVIEGYRSFFKSHFDDSDRIISGTPGGDVCVFSIEGDLLRCYKTSPKSRLIYDCAVVNKQVLAATSNQWVFVGDENIDSLSVCKPKENEKNYYRITYEIMALPDRDCFLATSDDKVLYVGKLSHPEEGLIPIKLPYGTAFSIARIDKSHVFLTGVGLCYIFNIDNHEIEIIQPQIIGDINSCAVLSDGRIVVGGLMGKISVIPAGGKIAESVSTLGNGTIRGIVEDLRRNHIYVTSSDGALRILDRNSLNLIATCYYLGSLNSVIFTPDGYYSASKSVANLIMYGQGADLFSFDRFDLVKNRPDIIRERLGGNKEEVELLHRVYQKRLKRMGYEENAVFETNKLPQISIVDFPSSSEVSADSIMMSIQCLDEEYPIKRIMTWLNGTPICGRDGMLVEGNKVTLNIPIKLASGKNHIEVSCFNAAGVESLRLSKTISYVSPKVQRNLYVVTMGVSLYQNKSYNLRYATKDAVDIANVFQVCGESLYDRVLTKSLTDEAFSISALEDIRKFLALAARDDTVIMFYAGHGIVGADYDYYLSTSETDFSHPEESSIMYSDLETIFDEIMPLNKLFLIDACHAGEIDKDDYKYAVNSTKIKGVVKFRGSFLGKESIESKILRSQFNDVRRGTGATILAGSNGGEVAVEGEQWKNGLFTWALKRGLQEKDTDVNNDGMVNVSELIRYCESVVTRLSGGKQSPSVRSLNRYCDFVVTKQE